MKQKLKLVLPSKKYLKSYQNFCRDFIKNSSKEKYSEEYKKEYIVSKDKNFFLEIKNAREGINQSKGIIPINEYWAVIDEKIVGRFIVRNKLPKDFWGYPGNIGYAVAPRYQGKGHAIEILRQGLLKAKKLGLKKVLLTCDADNIVSRRVIEKNRGKLKREAFHERKKIPVCFYWIIL